MASQPEEEKTPDIIVEAFDLLLQCRIVEITKHLQWDEIDKRKGWSFECNFDVSAPNKEELPALIPFKVFIPQAFPLTPVDFYPSIKELTGFPHQDAETRKLCLPEEDLAPIDEKRLACYVAWAKDWINDAINGNLLKSGDPYELPAFIYQRGVPILFIETAKSFELWSQYIGKSGIVELIPGKEVKALFTLRFFSPEKSIIWEPQFSQAVIEDTQPIRGKWLILPEICYRRHSPPKTFKEIAELCLKSNLDFYNDILKKAWEIINQTSNHSIILLGFPISKIFGNEISEIHWQPLIFNGIKSDRKAIKHGKKGKKTRVLWQKMLQPEGQFYLKNKLPWSKSVNIANERLHARGSFYKLFQSKIIAVFGCGALGSAIAEFLVRGGIKNIFLFDRDVVQFGNLCRHNLDGTAFGKAKAEALAKKLSTINPSAQIMGYKVDVPVKLDESIIAKADLLIDCTTSESAFIWLNKYAQLNNKKLVTLFFNFYANLLTICMSGNKISCQEVFQDLLDLIKEEKLPITSNEYLAVPSKDELVIEGAGCWHPTFPALNIHIQMLASSALEILNKHIDKNETSGLSALLRRNSINSLENKCIIEKIWEKEYL